MNGKDGLLLLSVQPRAAGRVPVPEPSDGRRPPRLPFGGHNNDMNQGLPADG